MLSPTDFPNDIDALKAMLIAAEARDQRKQERNWYYQQQCFCN
jgi:hypothetical protein